MKKTVQLLAFLVTASMVFTSASYKGIEIYFVCPVFSSCLSEPPVEQCVTEVQNYMESISGTEYWALYNIELNRLVKKTDLEFGETAIQHINRIGRWIFRCIRIRLIPE